MDTQTTVLGLAGLAAFVTWFTLCISIHQRGMLMEAEIAKMKQYWEEHKRSLENEIVYLKRCVDEADAREMSTPYNGMYRRPNLKAMVQELQSIVERHSIGD
jgi:hypothetical protein